MNYQAGLISAAALLIAGCGSSSVYDQPLPGYGDTDALIAIRDGVAHEDRDAWQTITMTLSNPMAQKIDAKTVREAVQRVKEKAACRERNAFTDTDNLPVPEYNKRVAAYNACLKMPL